MPTWSEILSEFTHDGTVANNIDAVRRKYLTHLRNHTGRNCILYFSGWLHKNETPPVLLSINDEDMQALMEVSYGLRGTKLDLILHSPGGSAEAAESIIYYLRSRFSDIRVIVPQLAMSAATIIACAADELVLGKHSFLGPTDPQFVISTALGRRAIPAQAILDQFKRAQKECADPRKLASWLPMLSQYGPDLISQCEFALKMSQNLVRTSLESYMFKDDHDGINKSREVSEWLADHVNFMSHSRHISRSDIEDHHLKVLRLEQDPILQDLVLSVFHATTHTCNLSSAVKIVESDLGRAFIKVHSPPSLN